MNGINTNLDFVMVIMQFPLESRFFKGDSLGLLLSILVGSYNFSYIQVYKSVQTLQLIIM